MTIMLLLLMAEN